MTGMLCNIGLFCSCCSLVTVLFLTDLLCVCSVFVEVLCSLGVISWFCLCEGFYWSVIGRISFCGVFGCYLVLVGLIVVVNMWRILCPVGSRVLGCQGFFVSCVSFLVVSVWNISAMYCLLFHFVSVDLFYMSLVCPCFLSFCILVIVFPLCRCHFLLVFCLLVVVFLPNFLLSSCLVALGLYCLVFCFGFCFVIFGFVHFLPYVSM